MKETDIRSRDVQDTYLELCRNDALNLLKQNIELIEVNCPACDSPDKAYSFTKDGYKYSTCHNCYSLFLSKRPNEKLLNDFNSQSKNAKYWAEEFYPSCADKRRNSVYKVRAEYVKNLEIIYNKTFTSFLDVGTGYGIFLEELKKLFSDRKILGLEPGLALANECEKRGLPIKKVFLSDMTEFNNYFSFCSCFEVIEHVFSPIKFLNEISSVCKDGGVFFTNTLCCDGFDIQIMWEKHRNIYPINHINILSIKGIEILFSRAGFKNIQISTPGNLDIDIIKNQMAGEQIPRFLQTIFRRKDDELLNDFQTFLKKNKLSSHLWVVGEKS